MTLPAVVIDITLKQNPYRVLQKKELVFAEEVYSPLHCIYYGFDRYKQLYYIFLYRHLLVLLHVAPKSRKKREVIFYDRTSLYRS